MANRHLSRSIVLQSLFEWDFGSKNSRQAKEIFERNAKEFAEGLGDFSFMENLLKGKPAQPFQRPLSVIQKAVCADTGTISGKDNSCKTRFEYFIRGTESSPKSGALLQNQDVLVNKDTQEQAKEGDPNTELKNQTVLKDATGDTYCITCAHPTPSPSPAP